ncbi:MAG: TIGR03564 family F420-dependent LLM class oxidoreductase [Acidobacteriota bacterium]
MKYGLMLGASPGPDATLQGIVDEAQRAESNGFDRVSLANIFSFDAICALTLAGAATQKIELGTAVVPTYPRHPTAIAQQALTANVASDGRFALGIGLSHKVVIEDMLGFSYERPARHMREYVQVLAPLLRNEAAHFDGEQYRVHAELAVPGAQPVPLLIAALGPVMLRLTGELADGTILWMTGPKTVQDHIVPQLETAARDAGRSSPRVVGGYPVVVTDDVATAREEVGQLLQVYGQLPSYRAMLDREGVEGPVDIALIGHENEVSERIEGLRAAGVTDFDAAITTTDPTLRQRSFELLASLAGA